MHRQVEAFAEKHCLSPKDLFEINLCMEEHFTNIISHGFADREPHWIEITIALEDNKFTARFEDEGIPFNPTQIPAPDVKCPLEERKIGGLGVQLTRHYMETISYARRGRKNVLVMTKKISNQK